MKKTKPNYKWVRNITIIAFMISLTIGAVTNLFISDLPLFAAFIVLLFVILLGITFDILGLAVATCTEVSFHAKLTKGHKEYKEAVNLIRNAEKVSSFCNDVIGDIAGVISGGLSAAIAVSVCNIFSTINALAINLTLTAVVACVTVGGKALGKNVAIGRNEEIVDKAAKIIYFFKTIFKSERKKSAKNK